MEEQPKVGPTALGKMVLFLFVLACIAGAAYYFRDLLAPGGRGSGKQVNLDDFKKVEAPDTTGITTVTEYKYVPAEKLPPVKGVSALQVGQPQKVVHFPINVWIGWLPIVAANGGFSPNPDSIFAKKYGFKVNLKLIDDPVVARDAFAAGESHVLWGTLDMMVLFAPDLMKDSRTAPRIFQQIDWSYGGDGIVVRGALPRSRTSREDHRLRPELSLPVLHQQPAAQRGRSAREVKHKFTATAFEAAAAFVADKSIDACVSWAPDIYNIPEKVKGTRVLTTTAEANKLIADVWAARADFAKDHPEVIKGLVAGIFDGMDCLKDATQREKAYQWMAEGYGMQADEVRAMANDAHSTNFSENKAFFLNANTPPTSSGPGRT